jgi:hypothetical protein
MEAEQRCRTRMVQHRDPVLETGLNALCKKPSKSLANSTITGWSEKQQALHLSRTYHLLMLKIDHEIPLILLLPFPLSLTIERLRS